MGYFDETLEHSAGAWKKHKYIRKDGKKYIYKETQKNEDGAVWDKYQNEDTGETIKVNRTFKYDPDRYDTKDFADDTIGEEAEEKLASVFKKKDKDKMLVKHSDDHLEHHGVLGQKWGIRRYQNADGSLTAEGKRRVYGDQGQYYGGYESFRNRHRRAIDAAKYEKDIAKNQKKLDKAYDKGDDKKIAKYTQIDKVLKNNRDIMVKDLSPEAIQMGRDYITQMKAITIGAILAGPIGGASAGMGVRYTNKMQETEKKVYAQEAERRKLGDNVKATTKELNDWTKANGLKAYEGDNAKITDRLTDNYMRAKDDLHNYNVNQQRRADGKPGVKVYRDSDDSINDKVKTAKKTGKYDMEFLEKGLDIDDRTGEPLKGKALDDAYSNYLKKKK